MYDDDQPGAARAEPIFNLPTIIVVLLVVQCAIHAVRGLLLNPREDFEFLITFAFIPARYDSAVAAMVPGGAGARAWSFLTYGFLHGDLTHLAVNMLFMVAFGSAVAWRFGVARFLVFSALSIGAGALVHLLTHFGEPVPMIGASAAVSGYIAAAIRFVFAHDPRSRFLGAQFGSRVHRPALPLFKALQHRGVVVFVTIWLISNFVFGMVAMGPGAEDAQIAWQAHLGGFAVGLLLFRYFDPIPAASESSDWR